MSLVATQNTGWSTGFRNLLSKELGAWWGTRRWLVHLVLWLAVIGGFLLLIALEGRREMSPAKGFDESMNIFFQVGGFFGVIGAVLAAQGSIVGERNSGTAAWVLTKPTTRKSFVLTKFVATTSTFLLLSLVIPAIAAAVICRGFWATWPPLLHYLEAIGILAVHQVFYLALTLMLGTLLRSRGSVGGVALGFWIAGLILPNFLPKWVPLIFPWPLTQTAASIALWKPVPLPVWIPVVSSGILAVIFLGVAMARFEREEF